MKRFSCICIPDNISSKKIQGLMIGISKECESRKALLFPPHISLRADFEIEDKDMDLLDRDLNTCVSSFKKIHLFAKNYGFFPWRVIYLDVDRSKTLQDLHSQIMMITQRYRTKWIPPYFLENINCFEDKQRKYIKEFGYHLAFEYYSPHFTLAGDDMGQKSFDKEKDKLINKNEAVKVTLESVVLVNRDNDDNIKVREYLLE